MWTGFLNTETGWLNKAFDAIGLTGPDWFTSEVWVYPALTLMGLWAIGNFMIINIAGLQSVPTELYEAARIDGAGAWTQLRRMTIPLMSPVLLYNLVISLIATFQYFTQAYMLTNGAATPTTPRCSSISSCSVRPSSTAGWATARPSPGCCSPSSCS